MAEQNGWTSIRACRKRKIWTESVGRVTVYGKGPISLWNLCRFGLGLHRFGLEIVVVFIPWFVTTYFRNGSTKSRMCSKWLKWHLSLKLLPFWKYFFVTIVLFNLKWEIVISNITIWPKIKRTRSSRFSSHYSVLTLSSSEVLKYKRMKPWVTWSYHTTGPDYGKKLDFLDAFQLGLS